MTGPGARHHRSALELAQQLSIHSQSETSALLTTGFLVLPDENNGAGDPFLAEFLGENEKYCLRHFSSLVNCTPVGVTQF
jgi:hypothetical protein